MNCDLHPRPTATRAAGSGPISHYGGAPISDRVFE